MTQQETIARALIARGYRELPSKTRKYRTFQANQEGAKLPKEVRHGA